MSVTIRPYRSGGWEIDIRVVTPDGARDLRERRPDDDAALHAPEPGRARCGHPAARRTATRAWFGLNRAVDLTLSEAPSCRSLETWWRRGPRLKNDQ